VALRLRVRRKTHIVTPVRFARAITGLPNALDPDPDDRGFAMSTRPEFWGVTDARGAMIGITAGQTVEMRVLREDIDGGAPVFITVTPADLIEVAAPASGGPLTGSDTFQIKGLKDEPNKCAKVQARLGDAKGPVLGELECHIFALKELHIVAHFVTIRGVPATLGLGSVSLDALKKVAEEDIRTVNAIYRPAGIQFELRDARIDSIDDVPETGKPFKVPGKVSFVIEEPDVSFKEVKAIMALNSAAHAINVYYVHRIFGGNNGFAARRGTIFAKDNPPGVVISDHSRLMGADRTLAHELGHYLQLPHPDQSEKVFVTKVDMWMLRRLMQHAALTPGHPPHHDDVGYGSSVRGTGITLKDFGLDTRDSECAILRKEARLELGR